MTLAELFILLAFSFIPAIVYVVWIRNTERYNLERWAPIALCFIWGAAIAIIASIILELLLGITLAISIENGYTVGFLSAVFLAPVVEEITKPLALTLKRVKRELDEIEDGFIYGAAAGLGFAATENLLYGTYFIGMNIIVFIIFMILRSVGGCLLHASATALTGYGYSRLLIQKTPGILILPYLLLAIILHSLYNFLVSFDFGGLVSGLILALLLVICSILYIRKKIQTFDLAGQ
jgi:RsiW-degrading membrane proteinase PrsW (M82 family)